MLAHGVGDVDLAQVATEGVGKRRSVAVCTPGGAKPGHSHSNDANAVKVKQVKRAGAHQERQRGIKPAGDTDNHVARVRVCKSFGQSARLDAQDVLAPLGAALRV